MKYNTKQALSEDIQTEHESLCTLLAGIPRARWHENGLWGNGWNLSDLVAHLAEWQFMFLRWYEDGLRGAKPEMPAPGFKWSQTPRLNQAIWEKHRSRSQAAIRADFEAGYRQILQLVQTLSPKQLLTPGHFEWTGKHPLATYLGPNTASHYRFAIKAIKRWLKQRAVADKPVSRPKKRTPQKNAANRPTKKKATRSHRRG